MTKSNGYGAIVEQLRGRIHAGELGTGARLPSVRELAAQFDVTNTTAQRAMAELQRAGYVLAQGRHGCVVADAWTRHAPAPGGAVAATSRPLRVGMIVRNNAAQYDNHPPQLVSLERMLTARVCADGGTIIRFLQREGDFRVDPALLARICRAPVDVLVIPNNAVRLDAASYRLLDEAGKVCIVYAGTVADPVERDAVRIDDAWAFRTITDRLWQMGHRRIAYVGLKPRRADWTWNQVRHAAWREALCARGASPKEHDAFVVENYPPEGRIPAQLAGYDAVVCTNDEMAGHVVEALRARGLRVPEDISVTGYDNACDVRLPEGATTLSLPYERVVAAILTIANRRMQRNEEVGDCISITLRPVLIPRGTWRARETQCGTALRTRNTKKGNRP